MKNIMGLPVITGSQPRKVHEFYESLVYNVQSLEILGKLKEITGYVRTTLDKLEGIRATWCGMMTIGKNGTSQN
jgi:glycine cleavage system protein P-like pyridoxal-binding family